MFLSSNFALKFTLHVHFKNACYRSHKMGITNNESVTLNTHPSHLSSLLLVALALKPQQAISDQPICSLKKWSQAYSLTIVTLL